MVNITFVKNDENKTVEMSVKGHAGYAEKGEDIVCSAVSILAYTLAEHLAVLHEKKLIDKPDIKINSGDCYIACKGSEDTYSYLLGKFAFIQLGYEIIENTYPENLSVLRLGDPIKD